MIVKNLPLNNLSSRNAHSVTILVNVLAWITLICVFVFLFVGFERKEPSFFDHTLLFIAILLLLAKCGNLIERLALPGLLGELAIGVLIGNLAIFGFHWFDEVHHNEIIKFLSHMGLVLLLFQAGLESNVKGIVSSGFRAFLVALVAVGGTFLFGAFVAGPLLLPDFGYETHLFAAASLTATSVGIAALLFRQYEQMQTKEASLIMGAAVIDDVFGMITLPVVIAIVSAEVLTASNIILTMGQAMLFLVTSVLLGQVSSPYLTKIFSRIHTGIGMKLALALGIGLIFAYLATLIGLAPFVGAFAAGLFLDPIHFDYFDKPKIVEEIEAVITDLPEAKQVQIAAVMHKHKHKHIEDLLEPLAQFMIPLFFITVGMEVQLSALASVSAVLLILGFLAVSIIGKVAAAFIAAGKNTNKWIVGFALIPNDEVGLIFATLGKEFGIFDDRLFGIIVTALILTTFIGSFLLNAALQRRLASAPKSNVEQQDTNITSVPAAAHVKSH